MLYYTYNYITLVMYFVFVLARVFLPIHSRFIDYIGMHLNGWIILKNDYQ